MDSALSALSNAQAFESMEGIINVREERKWVVEQAKEGHVPADVIGKALEFATKTQYDKAAQTTLAVKLLGLMSKKMEGE